MHRQGVHKIQLKKDNPIMHACILQITILNSLNVVSEEYM